MKLEVGQFSRLKSGYSDELGIGKISFVANCGVATIDFKNKNLGVFVEDIKKANYNIIDILEVGDYVNGSPICSFKTDEKDRIWIYTDSNYKCGYLENEIKTIVTHEQMEQIAYKVGD